MSRKHLLVVAWACVLGSIANAQDLPPLEAYGRLPEYDMYELSPSGKFGATRLTAAGRDLVVVFDVDTSAFVSGADAEKVNPRSLRFIDDSQLVLVAGRTVKALAVRNSFDYSSAYALNVATDEIRVLLRRAEELYPYQSGLGRIIGSDPESSTVFMPAYSGSASPVLSVFKVNLDNARSNVLKKGNSRTIDWFLDGHGRPLVREDFDDRKNIHQIYVYPEDSRKARLIYEEETEIPRFGAVGLTAARDALVLLSRAGGTGRTSYFLMSLENGAISDPLFADSERDIEWVITDINRVVYGVEFAGFKPTYAFFDKDLEERVKTAQSRLEGLSVSLTSWSQDFSRLVFEVSGSWSSGAYLMFEDVYGAPTVLGGMRSDIGKEHVSPIEIVEYAARDGLRIPALITARPDVREAGNGPLIVMPHGGPEAHDRYGFDWMAQYFASRGYVVLQPQFRGSDGFGNTLLSAGRGEWGGKMQSDLDDGVDFLVEQGIADPQRVCMFGASYGGYAALAAGAFSPDKYRCIVAFAPVADLRRMLSQERRERGRDNWALDYWEGLYGAEASEKEELKALSPVFHADAFKAPVLLIHGKKDTVVRIDQSKAMNKALRKAGKDVTFIQLKGEDHWLTQEDTRIEMLRAAAEFIERHL